ncbi:17873_t:CDS:1, partial [Cetraspora pellucida]
LSDIHISKIEATLVYFIQSCLKLHMKHTGQQTISASLTELEFVSIFQGHIKQYSICQQKYTCIFSGYNAYDTLANIFNQKNWRRQIYEHGQRTEVIQVSESTILLALDNSKLNLKDPEMIVIWKKHVINDNNENKSESSW